MTRRLLAVDMSNQIWRNLHANWALRHEDAFTGGLFGFLRSMAAYVRDTEATDMVVCMDRKPYVRSLEYPDYKKVRAQRVDEATRAAYEESVGYVLEALSVLGVPTMHADGFEADDCIARLVDRQRCRFDLIVAASSDSDLYQLLGVPNFRVMPKGFAQAVDSDMLFAEHGLTPEQFLVASALQGTHNDVDGIPGVGVKTAARAVHDPALMREMRNKHLPLIERNMRLIRLPHEDFPPLGMPLRTKRFNPRTFYRFCGRFGIDATQTMVDAFEQVS